MHGAKGKRPINTGRLLLTASEKFRDRVIAQVEFISQIEASYRARATTPRIAYFSPPRRRAR